MDPLIRAALRIVAIEYAGSQGSRARRFLELPTLDLAQTTGAAALLVAAERGMDLPTVTDNDRRAIVVGGLAALRERGVNASGVAEHDAQVYALLDHGRRLDVPLRTLAEALGSSHTDVRRRLLRVLNETPPVRPHGWRE